MHGWIETDSASYHFAHASVGISLEVTFKTHNYCVTEAQHRIHTQKYSPARKLLLVVLP